MNDSIGTGRIIDGLNKETSFSKFTFNTLLGGDFLLTEHRETLLVEIQKYSVKVFSAIHVGIATWIDYLTGGWNPCIFNQNRVYLLKHFLFHHFISLLENKPNTDYNFFFNLSRLFVYH
jgi:hypothetical protein